MQSATGPWGSLSWTYDGLGNRLTEVAGSTRTYAYPPTSNKLTSVTEGVTLLRNNTYDNAGNILTDVRSGVTHAFTYNKRNRLATVTVGGNLKGTYTYNAGEQLVKRVLTNMTPSGTTHFVHDLMGNVIAETNGVATGTVREYIWLPETQIAPVMAARAQVDRPLAVVDAVNTASPVTWWVTPDHLNRPVLMTDAAKAQVWQAVWKPFGEAQSLTGPAALDTRFPGQWFQIESGLHYNWHRHYDPTTGRYTQPDPLGFVDGPSVYAYSRSASLSYIDKDGRGIAQSFPPSKWPNLLNLFRSNTCPKPDSFPATPSPPIAAVPPTTCNLLSDTGVSCVYTCSDGITREAGKPFPYTQSCPDFVTLDSEGKIRPFDPGPQDDPEDGPVTPPNPDRPNPDDDGPIPGEDPDSDDTDGGGPTIH